MKKINYVLACYSIIIGLGCSTQHLQDNNINEDFNESESLQTTFRILALGDSYTIGQSVCESCKFPEQLKDSLVRKFEANYQFELKIIATTGWTTTNLIRAIETENITNEYDLVTLLIGVNNQYQNKSFSIYESEFPELVNTAIAKGKSDKNNCMVISIPDYAYTPFGNGNESISSDIDSYNNFAENYCETNGITYINITPITRLGLEQPGLVASDGLHPSKLAYSKFVELMLPYAINKLKD
ncbi:SGNH/GDSL hydrolase family protein [Aestuariivivens sediminis]|uniref:SGNH/GDSL hydrolase family protein n=1 Tax=Aestuariivivens sediminis TaxID=2913557 RepID=UPI001F5A93F9|nr:SGNH/GDSL hydrolase family protein [Aestuariivivens sediminis]